VEQGLEDLLGLPGGAGLGANGLGDVGKGVGGALGGKGKGGGGKGGGGGDLGQQTTNELMDFLFG
jgi:hypothetical protein